MGCCFGCLKPQGEAVTERTTLLAEAARENTTSFNNYTNGHTGVIPRTRQQTLVRGDSFYRSIVTEAHEKFIKSSKDSGSRNTSNREQDSARLRNTNFASSPPSRSVIDRHSHPLLGSSTAANSSIQMNTISSTAISSIKSMIGSGTTNNAANGITMPDIATASVISILSEPKQLPNDLEITIDEIGELVSRYVYTIPVEEGENSATLVQFRPVIGNDQNSY